MSTLRPDPRSVHELTALIVSLPSDRVGATFGRVLRRLYAGAVAKGWDHQAAADYAAAFGDQILSSICTMQHPTSVH
jgi:hypothetical protein